jgi:hypothetical protein
MQKGMDNCWAVDSEHEHSPFHLHLFCCFSAELGAVYKQERGQFPKKPNAHNVDYKKMTHNPDISQELFAKRIVMYFIQFGFRNTRFWDYGHSAFWSNYEKEREINLLGLSIHSLILIAYSIQCLVNCQCSIDFMYLLSFL